MASYPLARLRGKPRCWVTLTPTSIQFSDFGTRTELAWSDITDIERGDPRIRLHMRGLTQLYLYTATHGPQRPFTVDRYMQMGGSWLEDTIRYYWQHPDTRSQLATGSGQAPDPAANTAAHPWPRADQPGSTAPTPATEARRRRVLALLAAAFAAAAALGLLWEPSRTLTPAEQAPTSSPARPTPPPCSACKDPPAPSTSSTASSASSDSSPSSDWDTAAGAGAARRADHTNRS